MIVAGIVGVICILIAFLFDEFDKNFNAETISYNLLNAFGSALLMYYAYTLESWPFVGLNAVWLAAALIKLIKISRK